VSSKAACGAIPQDETVSMLIKPVLIAARSLDRSGAVLWM
jgi:hypothetical protein